MRSALENWGEKMDFADRPAFKGRLKAWGGGVGGGDATEGRAARQGGDHFKGLDSEASRDLAGGVPAGDQDALCFARVEDGTQCCGQGLTDCGAIRIKAARVDDDAVGLFQCRY